LEAVLTIHTFQASSDQLKIDIVLVFYIGASLSLCIAVITNVALTCQVAWPSVIAVLPLLFLNIWYRVWSIYPDFSQMTKITVNTPEVLDSTE